MPRGRPLCPERSASREGVPVEVVGWPDMGEGRTPGVGGGETGVLVGVGGGGGGVATPLLLGDVAGGRD